MSALPPFALSLVSDFCLPQRQQMEETGDQPTIVMETVMGSRGQITATLKKSGDGGLRFRCASVMISQASRWLSQRWPSLARSYGYVR